MLDTEAESSLAIASSYSAAQAKSTENPSSIHSESSTVAELSVKDKQYGERMDNTAQSGKETFEYMMLHSSPYLCALPLVTEHKNQTEAPRSKEDESKELARATDRGWELLKELEGGPCLYFESGWWYYSFCYNKQVKQFHALSQGKGAHGTIPIEDESVPSFILGQFPSTATNEVDKILRSNKGATSDLARAQTRGDMRYMVQKLQGGDICDITGRSRKVEVQFHCHPQSTDRIGLIKEVSTCAYLMVIYTPRLCGDVAFQPSKEGEAQKIVCREILRESEVDSWHARKSAENRHKLDGTTTTKEKDMDKSTPRPIVGGIELGGMKEVGTEGRRIDAPKVFAPEEQVGEIVAKWHPQENEGKIQQMTDQQLQDLELNGAVVREMRDALQEIANGKPFELRIVEKGDGVRELRGIVDDEGEDVDSDQPSQEHEAEEPDAGNQGSGETYQDEL